MTLGRILTRLLVRTAPGYNPTCAYRAAVLKEFKKPLVIESIEKSQELKPDQIRVAVNYCSLNYIDLKLFEGERKFPLPIVPGTEFSGEILELGSAVDKSEYAIGDRVVALTRKCGGGLAEEAVVDQLNCWTLSNISLKNAAILPYGHGTALLAFSKYAPIDENDIVIVLAGPAGLGLGAIEIASSVFKARVFAVSDTEASSSLLRDEGALKAVCMSEGVPAVYKYLRDAIGKDRAAVIYDAVGQGHLHTFQDFLCPEKGKLITVYPLFDMDQFKENVPRVEIKSKYKVETVFQEPIEERVQLVDLFKYRKVDPDFYRQVITDTFSLYDEELISAHVSETFPLERVNEALEFVREKKCTGKVVVDLKKTVQKKAKDEEEKKEKEEKKKKDDD